MKIIEIRSREIGFVLRDHCQNLLDDPRSIQKLVVLIFFISRSAYIANNLEFYLIFLFATSGSHNQYGRHAHMW